MKQLREYHIPLGQLPTGPLNLISDVPGVTVGHSTIHQGNNHTGVTVILPGSGNPFQEKYTAAAYVHNGYGKTAGLPQIQELGVLETPIALTNTLNVGLVWDGLLDWVLEQCKRDSIHARSVNPVVGECNDSHINDICHRAVNFSHVREAIASAKAQFEQGAVGAGTGTLCYGFKGGIGSSSRQITVAGKPYTVGALVQSNFGAMKDLVLGGRPVGQEALTWAEQRHQAPPSEKDQGSIMTVIATDLPLSDRQLYRVIRRAGVGIARGGAYTGHGSGEIMLGFTTANRIPLEGEEISTQTILREDLLDGVFQAVAEAVNEAILNSMLWSPETTGLNGENYPSLRDFLDTGVLNSVPQWARR
jgi:D-aminopeptidase